jgi:hypothetical protein
MTHPTDLPPAFTPTSIPTGGSVEGVYPVLEGVQAGNVLMGGYGYLQWSDAGGCWHEALDLNSMGGGDADLGARVVAPLGGIVTDVLWWDGVSQGFGNHLAMWIDDPQAADACYLHAAHLDSMRVLPGQRVAAGELLGTCGKSGFQPYAHTHAAMWWEVPPGGWSFWQSGYSKDWVAAHTLSPQDWFWASVAKAQGAPEEAVSMILSGAQTAAVQAAMFGDYWEATAPQFAIPTAWRDRWQQEGKWPGRAVSAEQDIPADPSEDKPAGKFQVFEHGCCVWLKDVGTSWNG